MNTAPASCSSATPGFPCLSHSYIEWMESPQECGHKRRNVILLSATPQTNGRVRTHTPQVQACLNAGGRKLYWELFLLIKQLSYSLGLHATVVKQLFTRNLEEFWLFTLNWFLLLYILSSVKTAVLNLPFLFAIVTKKNNKLIGGQRLEASLQINFRERKKHRCKICKRNMEEEVDRCSRRVEEGDIEDIK